MVFIAISASLPDLSQAILIYETAPIDELQIEGHDSVGREDVAWVKLSGSWRAINCLAGGGWLLNSKTSPHLLAAALTARATRVRARVYVDDGMT